MDDFEKSLNRADGKIKGYHVVWVSTRITSLEEVSTKASEALFQAGISFSMIEINFPGCGIVVRGIDGLDLALKLRINDIVNGVVTEILRDK